MKLGRTQIFNPRHVARSPVWRLMLAVGLGCQPEHLYMASLCSLGFLTTWLLGSQGECPERESQVKTIYDVALEIIQCHFGLILFVEANTVTRVEGQENRLHFLLGRW